MLLGEVEYRKMSYLESSGMQVNIQEPFTHVAIYPSLHRAVVADVCTFLYLTQDGEQPVAVGTEVAPGHDEHVAGRESVALEHHAAECGSIVRIQFVDHVL